MDFKKLKPKHVNKKFETQHGFNAWLNKTYDKKIILSDLGQDMTKIYIDEHGEILHCNFHAQLYNGRFINTSTLGEFLPLEILENGTWKRYNGLLVEEIEEKCLMECTSCDNNFNIETMESDDEGNYFCAECYEVLAPQMKADYEELVRKGEIEPNEND